MNWKHVIRYPLDIRIARRQMAVSKQWDQSTVSNDTPPSIGVDLYTDQMLIDGGRHLSCLASHAERIGSQLVLRCGRILLAAIAHKSHGRKFLAMPNVRWLAPNEPFPKQALVLLDIDGATASRRLDHCRTVAMLIGRDAVENVMVMPYPMHPDQIRDLGRTRVSSLRKTAKTGLFFAGNQKRRYGRETMRVEFELMSRLEILDLVKQQFPDRIVADAASGDQNGVVLRDSAKDPIEASQWMSTLASHQFFLCCPGASQPMCHNVIEAMAVGTIPVLEYSHRFVPELVDGENAICFEGPKGLAAAIRRIDSMSVEKRQRMSANVCQYYDAHLDGSVFLRRLRDELNTDFVDQICMPFHSRNLYSTNSPASGHVPSVRSKAVARKVQQKGGSTKDGSTQGGESTRAA